MAGKRPEDPEWELVDDEPNSNRPGRPKWVPLVLLLILAIGLFLLFPAAYAFAARAARHVIYLWWLILLVGLGFWLLFAFRKKDG
ncbi:MAG: hypothetical protein EA425_18305 [Puniceicoccaceae bacterium]|nr:MAG: hypothetical protein EA425_18305 [Puniceicoccaceae bacterium]